MQDTSRLAAVSVYQREPSNRVREQARTKNKMKKPFDPEGQPARLGRRQRKDIRTQPQTKKDSGVHGLGKQPCLDRGARPEIARVHI
jgi:hypothetical protein